MTLTITYLMGNGAADTVTLKNVESIRQTGAMSYAVQCFGNVAVTWQRVTVLTLAVDSAPAETVLDAPHIENFKTAKPAKVKPAVKPVKVYKCYKCGTMFTFKREASTTEPGLSTLSRIETGTGKPHECQGRPAAAIVIG